jgi:hypothetical protein
MKFYQMSTLDKPTIIFSKIPQVHVHIIHINTTVHRIHHKLIHSLC